MISKRIVLGTVQFGLDYGINNTQGEIQKGEAFDILKFAHQNGLDTLDTAAAYGSAESKLGEFFLENKSFNFKIISKSPSKQKISETALQSSLTKLNIKELYGYLAHDFSIFNNDVKLIQKFIDLKKTGLVKKIGFSLYYPNDLKFLLDNNINFDIIQLPYNIFDQRFNDWFKILKGKNVEIHIRSCFLQGLVFMDSEKLPKKLIELTSKLKKLHAISQDTQIPINALCIGFCLSNPSIDKLVLGIDSLEDLKMNVLNVNENIEKEILDQLYSLKETNEKLILPVNWQL